MMKKIYNKKEFTKVVMCTMICSLAILSPDYFYANNGGLYTVSTLFNNFYSIVSTIISGLGMIVALWCIAEIGGSWMGHGNGGTQVDAFKRMGGAIVWITAPHLVALFQV